MKKIGIILLSLVFTLGLMSCNNGTTNSNNSNKVIAEQYRGVFKGSGSGGGSNYFEFDTNKIYNYQGVTIVNPQGSLGYTDGNILYFSSNDDICGRFDTPDKFTIYNNGQWNREFTRVNKVGD